MDDKVNEKNIKQTLAQETAKGTKPQAVKDIKEIKKLARSFLKKADEIGTLGNSFLSARGRTEIDWASYEKMPDIIQNYKKQTTTTFIRKMLTLQHSFDKSLDKILNRKITLTYVNEEDGNIFFYNDRQVSQLYKNATAGTEEAEEGRTSGSISANFAKLKNKKGKSISPFNIGDDKDLQKRLKESLRQKNKVYVKLMERYNSNDDEEKKKYNPSENTFYWRIYDAHHITNHSHPFANKGDIAEAYVNAVVNEDNNINNNSIEQSLRNLYFTYLENVSGENKHDSLSAISKGDVKLKENGYFQFAVKTNSFSTASFTAYIRFAINILALRDDIPLEYITEDFLDYFSKQIGNTAFNRLSDINRAFAKDILDKEVAEKIMKSKNGLSVNFWKNYS